MRPAWRLANGSVPPPRAKPQHSPPVTPPTPAGHGELNTPSYQASSPPRSAPYVPARGMHHGPRTLVSSLACCGVIFVILLHIDGAAEGFVFSGGPEVQGARCTKQEVMPEARGPRPKGQIARCTVRGPRPEVPGPRAKNQVTRSTDHAARTSLPAPRSLVLLR